MSDDDLSKLTPTDPAAVDHEWTDKRRSILDGVLAADAPRRSGARRWVAGVAAAALVVVAVGGITQQLRREPWATPATPAPTSTIEPTDLVAAQSVLVFEGDAVKLCRGGSDTYQRQPACEGIPVTGLTLDDVPWAEQANGTAWADVIVTGTFDGTTMTAVDVFEDSVREAPQPAWRTDDYFNALGDLCSQPTTGNGHGDRTFEEVAMELPGYQGAWVNGKTHSVAVTGGVEAVRRTLVEQVQGDFCVGTIPGPSVEDGEATATAVAAVQGVEVAHFGSDIRGAVILVQLLTDDAGTRAEIEELVGPTMWPSMVITSFFYPVVGSPTSPPLATDPPIAHGEPVMISGMAQERDGVMGICYENALTSGQTNPSRIDPPRCEGGFVPVTGIKMPGFDDLSGLAVGTFDGSVFHATGWYSGFADLPAGSVDYPSLPAWMPDICEPQPGIGATAEDELEASAGELPGYQAIWREKSEKQGTSWRIAVTHGAEAAQQTLLARFGVSLCVGTVPGPDVATLHSASKTVTALFPRAEGELEPWINTRVTANRTGTRLSVVVLDATPEIRASIEEAVGPEIWPWTDVKSTFDRVGAAALDQHETSPTPMPSGPTPPLEITDADRRLAEKSVATDLLDADNTSASSTMAKATFEQYEALWSVDWENDFIPAVIPLPNDTVVLVVTLSAPLTVTASGGGDLAATGTLVLIDADTGDTILHVGLSGGSPEDRLTELPGPIENVALPEGFS